MHTYIHLHAQIQTHCPVIPYDFLSKQAKYTQHSLYIYIYTYLRRVVAREMKNTDMPLIALEKQLLVKQFKPLDRWRGLSDI